MRYDNEQIRGAEPRRHHQPHGFGPRRSAEPGDVMAAPRGPGRRRPGPAEGRGAHGRGGPDTPFGPRHGRRRRPRGDVRAAVLLLLAEQPRHGYELMQAIADRSGGRWTPSPGAVYPTIAQLEDEGLVTVTPDSGRKLVALTDAGRGHLDEHQEQWPDPFADFPDDNRHDLRRLLEQLHGAAREVGRTGSEAQIAAASEILADARRSLYQLLADGAE